MGPIEPIAAHGASLGQPITMRIGQVLNQPPASASGFGDILAAGMQQIDTKIGAADALVKRFALDDAIPVHQVTMALEEARLAVELAMQVRSRVLETYRDFMSMQV